MKKLNEIVSNELLHELREQLEFDWINDNVNVAFYSNYQRDDYLIGRFYSLDLIGEFLLEKFTIKAYQTKVEYSERWDSKFVEIQIVLNTK